MSAGQEGDPWKDTARQLRESWADEAARRGAAAVAAETHRLEAEQRTEEGRQRIREFLERMEAAGNPGCREIDLNIRRPQVPLTRSEILSDKPLRVPVPYQTVLGWVVDNRSFRAHPRDSVSDQGDFVYQVTVLSVDGEVFDVPLRVGDNSQLDPATVTMEMLVRTLIENGVEV